MRVGKFGLWIFTLYTLIVGSVVASETSPAIVGGNEVSISSAPWQVFVYGEGASDAVGCGGSIIADNYILTAAHCLYDYPTYSFSIFAGNARWADGSRHEVTDYYLHEDYDPATLENDIALLKITGTLPSNTRAIPLVTENNQDEFDQETSQGLLDNLYVTGWGKTTPDRQDSSPVLLGTELTGISDSVCIWNQDNNGNYSQYLADMRICANHTQEKGVCSGDSGGPLVWKDPSHAGDEDLGIRLIGVVSFTSAVSCGNSLYPDGFVEVSHYRSWISQKMEEGGDGGDSGGPGGGGDGNGGDSGALVGGGGSAAWLLFFSLMGFLSIGRKKHLS